MLNINIKNGDMDYSIDNVQVGIPECEKSDFNTEYIFYMSEADERKLFVRRDSFSSSMMSFVAAQFENSLFMNYMSFSQQQIFDYETDVFVLEIAERYISSLEDFRISFIDYFIEEEGSTKVISIVPTLIFDDSKNISIYKKSEGTDELIQYQVRNILENGIKIKVSDNESGEIYISVFENNSGDTILEKLTIKY